MKFFKQLSVISLALLFTFSSCEEALIIPASAPELPPASSMEMDFSSFEGGDEGGKIKTEYNRGTAVTAIGVWHTVLAVGLAVPVSSFKVAVSQTPSYDTDRKVWVWSFDHNVVGRTYSFELTGKVSDDHVEWKMYASEEDGFQDALWYYGETEIDGSGGFWVLNKDGNEQTNFLRIDWAQENDDVASIKYTNIDEGDQNNGAYIEYGKIEGEFNRFYNIVGLDNNSVLIEWHEENGNGRIKISGNSYQCWDTEFQDIEC